MAVLNTSNRAGASGQGAGGGGGASSFYDYQIPYALKLTRSPSSSGGTNGSGFNKAGQAYPNTSTCVYWTLSFWIKKTLATDEYGPIDGGTFYQTICNNIENHGGKGLYFTYGSGASNADIIQYRASSSTSFDPSGQISQSSNFPLGVNQAHPAHYFGLFLNGHGHTEGNSYGTQGIVAETIIRHSISGDTIANYGFLKNGVWVPRDPTDSSYINSTFGSEGLWFKYADSSNLGLDSSGNGNNLDTVNLSADNQVIDTPTNDGS